MNEKIMMKVEQFRLNPLSSSILRQVNEVKNEMKFMLALSTIGKIGVLINCNGIISREV